MITITIEILEKIKVINIIFQIQKIKIKIKLFYLFTLKTIIKCNANNVYLIENVILTEYNKDNKDN